MLTLALLAGAATAAGAESRYVGVRGDLLAAGSLGGFQPR
jgi:hypothetical protein